METSMSDCVIRPLAESEIPLLDDFLYEAIFVPDGAQAPSRAITQTPELQVYIKDFGTQRDDCCLVAEVGGRVVGAVWVRDMPDYGHVASGVPSFAVALLREYRAKGIGTQLMQAMLAELAKKRYTKASLSVQKANYAARWYQKLGFEIIGENEEEYVMIYDFRRKSQTK